MQKASVAALMRLCDYCNYNKNEAENEKWVT